MRKTYFLTLLLIGVFPFFWSCSPKSEEAKVVTQEESRIEVKEKRFKDSIALLCDGQITLLSFKNDLSEEVIVSLLYEWGKHYVFSPEKNTSRRDLIKKIAVDSNITPAQTASIILDFSHLCPKYEEEILGLYVNGRFFSNPDPSDPSQGWSK